RVVMRTAVQVEAWPDPALRPYVASYAGFELRGFPSGIHLGTPGRFLTVVVSLSEPLDVVGGDGMAGATPSSGRFGALAGGLTSRSVAIRHDGNQHGVRLSLTPLGARAIFGMPSAALAHELVHLEEVLGRLGAELVDRMRRAETWSERFATLDAVLARVARRRSVSAQARQPMRPEVAEAWRRLVVHRGRLRIGSLAADLGWSRRHLGDHFRTEIGLTPKEAARILRFEHACELATASTPQPWAVVSAAAGYSDQAHLVRDWREFTGCAPTAWRRSEVLSA
nr:helix-turn-helix domain-containing protein [Micromonospora sp. DSM 115978]